MRGAVGPAAEICSEPCRALPRAREDLDNAGYRIGAVQDAHRSADDFDAIDVVGREMRQIDRAACLVQRHAVEQHLGVIALTATHEQRRLPAETPRLGDVGARNRFQRLRHRANALREEIGAPQHGHRRRDEIRRNRCTCRGHDHRF